MAGTLHCATSKNRLKWVEMDKRGELPLTNTWDCGRQRQKKRRQTYERRWSCRWRGACPRGCGRQRRRWTRGLASRFFQSSTSSPWNLQVVRKLSFFFIYLWLISLCSTARTCEQLSYPVLNPIVTLVISGYKSVIKIRKFIQKFSILKCWWSWL